MKKFVSIVAVLLFLPGVAMAAKWSADLDGADARQEGFASINTTHAGTIVYTIMANGIGVPTRAAIRRGGSDLVDLGAEFNFSAATGTLVTGLNLSGLVNANLTLRIEGPNGTLEGPISLIAGADANVNTLQRNFGGVAVGSVSAARNIIVTNDGTADLRVANLLIRGAGRARFNVVANQCQAVTLRPGQRCVATIRFLPAATGEVRALAVVDSSDFSKRQIRVQLRGTGN